MTIIECDASWRDRWDAFAAACPHASLYHLWAWGDLNREALGHRWFPIAAVEGDTIRGILPVVQVRTRLFGNLGCSMPFVNFGGPAGDTPEVDAALLQAAERVRVREGMRYLELRSTRELAGAGEAQLQKITLTVDLPKDPDVMWNGFKTGHRQDIRKAVKTGYTARHGGRELLAPFFDVLSESWRDLGTPFYSFDYFDRLFRMLGDRLFITIVDDGTEAAAAQLSGVFAGTAEGMWLGMRERHRRRYVGYVLYWEILKHATERGLTRYHLGRSSADSGAEAFKKKWNAYPKQLYWYHLLDAGHARPALNVKNPRYQRAIELWQRLPLGIARVIGPPIARGIP